VSRTENCQAAFSCPCKGTGDLRLTRFRCDEKISF